MMMMPPSRKKTAAAAAFALITTSAIDAVDAARSDAHVKAAAFAAAKAAVSSSVDFTDTTQTLTIADGVASWINYYFTFSVWTDWGGAWDQNIVQWHESGIYYNTIFSYMNYSGKFALADFASTSMMLATHQSGDLLNGCVGNCGGTWNDDIGWWGLASIAGGDVFGKSAIITSSTQGTGQSWLYVANFTLYEMLQDQDNLCGGGVYWSRDRASNQVNKKSYKSAISNEEVILISAKLHARTGDPAALKQAITSWDWTVNALVDRNRYYIYDGIYADGTCSVQDTTWAYHYGVMINSGVLLYKATQNATYLSDAKSFYTYWRANFVNAVDTSFYNPLCSANPGYCKDPSGYEWPLYEALAVLYNALPAADAAVKTDIKTVMAAQGVHLAAKLGCDAAWLCTRTLSPVPTKYTFPNGTNPRDQIEMLAFVNGMVAINGAPTPSVAPPTISPTATAGAGKAATGAAAAGAEPAGALAAAVVAALVGVVALLL